MRKPIAIGVASLVILMGLSVPAVATAAAPGGLTYAAAPATKLKLSKDSLTAKYKADSTKLTVKSGKASWTATSSAPWVTVTPESGSDKTQVTISVAANLVTDESDPTPRSASVTFTSGVNSATFIVNQAAQPYIGFSPGGDWVPVWTGDTKTFTVDTRGSAPAYNCTIKTNDPWLSVVSYTTDDITGKGSLTLAAAENIGKFRNATAKVSCGDGVGKIKVRQDEGPYMGTLPGVLILPNEGGTGKVKVNSPHADWTGQVTSGADWISLSATSGLDAQWITVTVAANPAGADRTGSVHFQNGYDMTDLTVTQTSQTLKQAVLDYSTVYKMVTSIISYAILVRVVTPATP